MATTTARFSSWPRAAARVQRWLLQRHQRGKPSGRRHHGRQRQSVRHNLWSSRRHYPVNHGTVFELAKGSGTITTLASFSSSNPAAGLIMDSSGDLYGTTGAFATGDSGDGTVFKLAKGSDIITTLASFNGTNGSQP